MPRARPGLPYAPGPGESCGGGTGCAVQSTEQDAVTCSNSPQRLAGIQISSVLFIYTHGRVDSARSRMRYRIRYRMQYRMYWMLCSVRNRMLCAHHRVGRHLLPCSHGVGRAAGARGGSVVTCTGRKGGTAEGGGHRSRVPLRRAKLLTAGSVQQSLTTPPITPPQGIGVVYQPRPLTRTGALGHGSGAAVADLVLLP